MKELILGWLESGAPLSEGIRLFSLAAGKDHPFISIIKANHIQTYPILIHELCRRHHIDPPQLLLTAGASVSLVPSLKTPKANRQKPTAKSQKPKAKSQKPTFRNQWPFLSQPDCPPELKMLTTNKITAYHNYVQAHTQLFDCTSSEQQFSTVKFLVENYIENRQIIDEFTYYKEHNHCLGQHPVFKELQELKTLRQLSQIELFKLQKKTEQNIWRIESNLKKNDKPHLRVARESRLQTKKNQLAEILRLLSTYQ